MSFVFHSSEAIYVYGIMKQINIEVEAIFLELITNEKIDKIFVIQSETCICEVPGRPQRWPHIY